MYVFVFSALFWSRLGEYQGGLTEWHSGSLRIVSVIFCFDIVIEDPRGFMKWGEWVSESWSWTDIRSKSYGVSQQYCTSGSGFEPFQCHVHAKTSTWARSSKCCLHFLLGCLFWGWGGVFVHMSFLNPGTTLVPFLNTALFCKSYSQHDMQSESDPFAFFVDLTQIFRIFLAILK